MGAHSTNRDAHYGGSEIGLMIYPGVQWAAVYGLTDLVLTANRVMMTDGFELEPICVSHWSIEGAGALPIRTYQSFDHDAGSVAALVVPPTLEAPPSSQLAAPYLDWLRQKHSAGTVLSSVCAGTFLLAQTGLLDGRAATTHWMHAKAFRNRFPKVRLDVEQLLLDEGDVLTAGGVMAWTDLGLRLVERLRGTAVMIETARALLIDPPGRQQRFYSRFMPPMDHGDRAVLKAQKILMEKHGKDVSLPDLVTRSGLEERTFLRRFRAATGFTTTRYAQGLRIARAQELLQRMEASVDQIAWEVGYADPASFRKTFTRIIGLSPSAYRRRLSGRRDDAKVQRKSGSA
ncbi:AraC family transcriptional regulator [Novosphingobium sp. Rr 2-17]|uniref:GlxA family transcriptional regulator n=1 Tax=Novosphingobium sp. Rr 2-17 TaxID=555793 RepID=UPI0002699F23|nr:helix-turn-helix domain-containing protein [Novosphingobium sp. Rr 2-17]EIZ77932.1 AraC family transcriptional regulator [Novosphingobium sp. Rr 2-17]